jgi:hypothetical protein
MGEPTLAHIGQLLIAVLAEMGVPLLCTETHEMAEEVLL